MFANLNPCPNRRFFGSKYAWGVSPLKNTVGGLQKYSWMPAPLTCPHKVRPFDTRWTLLRSIARPDACASFLICGGC